MQTDLFDEELVKKEAKKQNDYLNTFLGILLFTFAFSSLGLEAPWKGSAVCIAILLPLFYKAVNYVPETILTLRILVKEHPDNEELKRALRYLEKKYLGFRSVVTGNLVYLVGIIMFSLVGLSPEFVHWLKSA
jgi:Ca2+/H+ antiporter